MARENRTWGSTRITSVLFNLGHDIARNMIKAILKERGIEPAPERGRHTSRHTFIKSHWGAIAGDDFFMVEAVRGFELVRHYAFFVLDIGSRRVHFAGITHQSSEACTKALRTILKDAGVNIVRLPARSPNLNSHSERWIDSLRAECLCRIIPLGEKHFRATIRSYVEHYHLGAEPPRYRQSANRASQLPLAYLPGCAGRRSSTTPKRANTVVRHFVPRFKHQGIDLPHSQGWYEMSAPAFAGPR